MAIKHLFRFQKGEPGQGAITAKWTNTVEERLFALESLKAEPPLHITRTSKGMTIGYREEPYYFVKISSNNTKDPNTDILRVDNELHPYEDAIADILGFKDLIDTDNDPGSARIVDETAEDEFYPRIIVVDVFGTSSQVGTKGLVLNHPNSDSERLVFIPFPVAGGEPIANYNSTKNQALIHTGQGVPQWVDIDDCEVDEVV